jgi:hypothetical protein
MTIAVNPMESTYSSHTHGGHGDALVLSAQLGQSSDDLACTSSTQRVTEGTS